MAKKGLGRGLDALLGDISEPAETVGNAAGITKLPLEKIIPDPEQPRKSFDDEALAELASSIREKGLLQPVLVRPSPRKDGFYQIVAGERRWRACQIAQLHDVPVLIRELSDAETAEIALIENVQRVDLNPMEEAEAYHRLVDSFGHTAGQVAEAVGKSRSHVANMMRLLKLPEKVRDLVREGTLSMGHARALIGAPDPALIADYVIYRNLSVRDTEAYVMASLGNKSALEHGGKKPRKDAPPAGPKSADIRALENDLASALGLEVSIQHTDKKGGTVTISYSSLDQMDDICGRLMNSGL